MPALTLADKITSKEDWSTVAESKEYKPQIPPSVAFGAPAEWWVARERARLRTGHYSVTPELEKINRLHFGLCAHVSRNDPKMVAYTPDRASGEADRQVIANPGRFFSKYLHFASEAVVRNFTEAYNSYVNLEVEFISGTAIAEAYEQFGSAAACMSGKNFAVHPALAYNAPNIRLAVCRDKQGNISGRTLVYEPREDDKRYIRAYGNPALVPALQRMGYKVGNLVGARLARVEVGEDTYAVPYLDGDGTYCSPVYSSVAALPDCLKVLSHQEKRRFSILGFDVKVPDTSGTLKLKSARVEDFEAVDAFSGKLINRLTDQTTTLFMGGVFQYTKEPLPDDFRETKFRTGGARIDAYVPQSELVSADGGAPVYPNHAESLTDLYGLVRLKEEHYGPNVWTHQPQVEGVLKKDVVKLVTSGDDDGWEYVHKSEIPPKSVKLHPYDGMAVYAAPGAKYYLTPGKRKVHPRVHDLTKLFTGDYDFSRNVLRLSPGYGLFINYSRKDQQALQAGEFTEILYSIYKENFFDLATKLCVTAYQHSSHIQTKRDCRDAYSIYSGLQSLTLPEVMSILEESLLNLDYRPIHMDVVIPLAKKLFLEYAEMSATEY